MSGLPDRLRAISYGMGETRDSLDVRDAAWEIDRLQREIERLRRTLIRIANADYRFTMSKESLMAFAALKDKR